MKSFTEFAQFMSQMEKLKRLPRKGWIRSGVKQPESVADHSFRIAVMALVLSDTVEGLNKNKVIKMALCHDWAESVIGDITPYDNISKEEKSAQERKAFVDICSGLTNCDELVALWDEFEAKETKEAVFVNHLDKLEMMFQAHEYGTNQPDLDFEDFWEYIKKYDFGEIDYIFKDLEKSRQLKE